jgi:hypothetical protein
MGVNEDLHIRISHTGDVRISTNGTHTAMGLSAYKSKVVPLHAIKTYGEVEV